MYIDRHNHELAQKQLTLPRSFELSGFRLCVIELPYIRATAIHCYRPSNNAKQIKNEVPSIYLKTQDLLNK